MRCTRCRFALGLVTGRMCAITSDTHGKEPGAAPGRAGDGARDRREAGIGGSLPVEALAPDRDGVALAVILANEHRAGLSWRRRAPPCRARLSRDVRLSRSSPPKV